MKTSNKYDIEIFGLEIGTKHFDFEIEDDFFQSFDYSPLEKGKLTAEIILNKSETVLEATFIIKGTVELTCDRSLKTFDYIVDIIEKLIFKYGNEYQELSDEIIIIPRETQVLKMKPYLFEFINLSVPMRKLHPDHSDTDESKDNESELIYSSSINENNKTDHNKIDPRWSSLKTLKK